MIQRCALEDGLCLRRTWRAQRCTEPDFCSREPHASVAQRDLLLLQLLHHALYQLIFLHLNLFILGIHFLPAVHCLDLLMTILTLLIVISIASWRARTYCGLAATC